MEIIGAFENLTYHSGEELYAKQIKDLEHAIDILESSDMAKDLKEVFIRECEKEILDYKDCYLYY